jgi:hypothetical protein
METYWKASIRIASEDDKGRTKYRRENYLVYALSPTDVEAKLAEHLNMADYEVTSINLQNYVEIIGTPKK